MLSLYPSNALELLAELLADLLLNQQREAAAADLPFVKDLAEQYADRHNAVIYWGHC